MLKGITLQRGEVIGKIQRVHSETVISGYYVGNFMDDVVFTFYDERSIYAIVIVNIDNHDYVQALY